LSSESPPSAVSHLDHPHDWTEIPRQLTIQGWAFLKGQGEITDIQALVGDRVVSATLGYHRPDVSAAYPQAPGDYCGFQIATRAPSGKFAVELQFRAASTTWISFFKVDAQAPRWRRPFALGGGNAGELLSGQLSLIPQYTPRQIQRERFPSTSPSPTNLPKLSIVTPSFNQGKWLNRCIVSVRDDNEPGVKHLVQDGGSTDTSIEVLKSHDSHLHSWVSRPDGGQAAAINQGFAETSGRADDLMAWINADDHYLPGAIPFVRRFFASNPEIDVVYGNRVLIDDQGQEIGRWHLPPHHDEVLRLYDFVPQETLFWRRRAWQKSGGLDASFRFALDWDLLLRFQSTGARIVHLPRFLAAFRLHSHQKSAAQIGSIGQAEIDQLRHRTFGRDLSPEELINSPVIESYLRQSARREFAAKCGWRPRIYG
jgi:hypothetical protein